MLTGLEGRGRLAWVWLNRERDHPRLVGCRDSAWKPLLVLLPRKG